MHIGATVSTVSGAFFLSLHAFICGGNWNNGVHDGDRAVNCNNYPWNVNTNIGVWCVCDYMELLDGDLSASVARAFVESHFYN